MYRFKTVMYNVRTYVNAPLMWDIGQSVIGPIFSLCM